MRTSFFTLVFLLSSFAALSQITTNFTKENYSKLFDPRSVPADLKTDGHILIVGTPFKEKQVKENADIKAIFDSSYNGKFILAPLGGNLTKDKTYEDKNIYKYMIVMMPTMEEKIHLHYSIMLIDRIAYEKNKSDYLKTNLADDDRQLNAMLIFYAKKLSEARDQ